MPAHVQTGLLRLRLLGVAAEIRCDDGKLAGTLEMLYAALAASPGEPPSDPVIRCAVGRAPGRARYWIALDERLEQREPLPDIATLLFRLDKALILALQARRSELLFVHAAALAREGSAVLLAGESGRGKSTTAWALLHRGFEYLSDELSPIDIARLSVLPYPRALSLKRRPPPPFPLPREGVVDAVASLHVAASAFPSAPVAGPCAMAAVLFVQHRSAAQRPRLQRLSAGEGTARLYVNTLNALAHPQAGLGAVAHIAERVPCFELEAAELEATADAVCRLDLQPLERLAV